jgi:5-(carboxyamino)imidazole ribonucleotide synthase
MMLVPAIEMGLTLKVFSEAEGSSAQQATTQVGDYTQLKEIQAFAETVDVITFDHEHVPIAVLEALEMAGVSVQPPSKALINAQNKLSMRLKVTELGLPMPAWSAVKTASELDAFIATHNGVAVVKTPIGGYDGKGVRVVNSAAEVSEWLEPAALAKAGGKLLAEEKVEFVREVAQLSARTPSGDFKAWPLVQTTQRDGVCAEVVAPAPGASASLLMQANEIAHRLANGLGVTGVFAVEMFETADGRLLINELAMRPHNSGHFSIEGSVTSQFEQHLRAVLDLPLGETELRAPLTVMLNLLGTNDSNDFFGALDAALAAYPAVKFHSYGKTPRAGRKMGHLTITGDTLDVARAQLEGFATVLNTFG